MPETWVTLFALGREVLMPWTECSVMEERLRFVARLLDYIDLEHRNGPLIKLARPKGRKATRPVTSK